MTVRFGSARSCSLNLGAILAAVLLTATALTAGCSKSTGSASGAPPTPNGFHLKILHYGNGAEPQDLDPVIVTGTPEHHLLTALLEGLVIDSPDDKGVLPGVAEKWEISDDGLVYTFHLRSTARWSNGDPVTAQDFVGSYRRMLTAGLGADYAYMLFHVAGAEDFFNHKITDFSQTGFKALDDHTLQLHLAHRAPFLLNSLTHYAWFPVHLGTVAKFGGLTERGTNWTRAENFVGNGPFRIKEWKPNQWILAEKSPTYWDRDHVKLDQIYFHAIELSDSEERMFRTGQLDVVFEVPVNKIAVYQRDHPESIRIEPYCGIYLYRFNIQRKPLDDVRVRRALALAIDRESLVKNVTRANELPAYQIVPPNLNGYNSQYQIHGDIAEARRLLAEAGFPDGKGFPHLDILYNTLEKHRVLAEAIQQMWRQNLGIEVGIYNQEWKVYLDSQKRIDFDIQRSGWIADYIDPHVFFDLWRTGGGNNNTNWGSPEYDRLLEDSLNTKTDAERYAIYQKMEKILEDEMPVVPIYFYTYARLIRPTVLNYHTTYLDTYPWKFVDMKE